MPWVRRLGEGLADLLFPPLCVVCRTPSHRHLCDACLRAMAPMQPPICHHCGRGLDPSILSADASFRARITCKRCRELGAAFTACRAYGPYGGALRAAIHAVKYDGRRAAVPALGEILFDAYQRETLLHRARAVLPVPLHPSRRRERGFNQSELLARELCRHAGLDLRDDVLARVRRTRPQVGLNAEQRRENIREAFQAVGEVPEAPLLLVDDVVTTGATLHECARVLRAAGSGAVYALALAHD